MTSATPMPRLVQFVLGFTLCVNAVGATQAQCPTAKQLTHAHMKGEWQVVWQDPGRVNGSTETVRFAANPEFPDSLSGELSRGKQRLQLAGDLEDGQLTLEESPDGRSISATWTAQVQAGSCGTAFHGSWARDSDSPVADRQGPAQRAFVLRRSTGW